MLTRHCQARQRRCAGSRSNIVPGGKRPDALLLRWRFGFVLARYFFNALVAVLAGNALYFAVLSPLLPAVAHHRPYSFDLGLGLDFLLCLGAHLLLNRWVPRR